MVDYVLMLCYVFVSSSRAMLEAPRPRLWIQETSVYKPAPLFGANNYNN